MNDLLSVIENLVTFDPQSERIRIVPILLSNDSSTSVAKQTQWRRKNLGDIMASRDIANFTFPDIKPLGPLNTRNEEHCEQILKCFAQEQVDLIISDSSMGEEMAGILLLNTALSAPWTDYRWQCWLTTKWDRVAKTIRDFRWRGKFDPYARYLDKNPIIQSAGSGVCDLALREVVERAIEQLEASRSVAGRDHYGSLVGKSAAMNGKLGVYELIQTCARKRKSNVFIYGETGTGKELVAREIHESSKQPGSFISYNSANFNKELMESDLFGHVKGAFTGATELKKGLFEEAVKGTLFLDEIAEIPADLQAKLLRVLQERKLCRMGDLKHEIDVSDVRVVAATSKNIPDLIERELFRADLYYRLYVLDIKIAPLRERAEDIPLLARHFVALFNQANDSQFELTDDAVAVLMSESWPGNVRELRNCIERSLTYAEQDQITAEDIRCDSNSGRLRGDVRQTDSSSVGANHSVSLDDCANMSAAEILNLLQQGKLRARLSELKDKLNEPSFVQLLRLIQQWTHEKYNREHLPEELTHRVFGMDGKSYRQRMYQYKQKYGI
ncbi:MAG TPA: hypothetical protein DC047_06595 [Blastocatellia bacterium]|nr:hypothetical protein [Blastocatellia bacterium]